MNANTTPHMMIPWMTDSPGFSPTVHWLVTKPPTNRAMIEDAIAQIDAVVPNVSLVTSSRIVSPIEPPNSVSNRKVAKAITLPAIMPPQLMRLPRDTMSSFRSREFPP